MTKAEKDVRDFHASYSPQALQAEILWDERTLRRHFYSIRQKRFQDHIKSRIGILKAMLVEMTKTGTSS